CTPAGGPLSTSLTRSSPAALRCSSSPRCAPHQRPHRKGGDPDADLLLRRPGLPARGMRLRMLLNPRPAALWTAGRHHGRSWMWYDPGVRLTRPCVRLLGWRFTSGSRQIAGGYWLAGTLTEEASGSGRVAPGNGMQVEGSRRDGLHDG